MSSRERPVKVRRADLPRTRKRRIYFGLFRFLLYGFVGISSEVIFYNLVRIGRQVPLVSALFQFSWKVDPRLDLSAIWDSPTIALFGQCSLWMFLVYAVASFGVIEPIYRRTVRKHVALRALFYGLAILAFEAVSGWLLFWGTGYRIWYYDDALNIVGMTSLFILPIWMITGLLVELIYRELMDPDLLQALESPLPPVGQEPMLDSTR